MVAASIIINSAALLRSALAYGARVARLRRFQRMRVAWHQ
jgi:hypothetical protein